MAIKTPPYLKWREGRPRWEPGPRLRAEGWRGQDIKDEQGAWQSLGGAIIIAEQLNADVLATKAAGRPPKPTPQPIHTTRTLWRLHARWIASPEYRALAAKTRADYAHKAIVFMTDFGRDTPVAAITRKQLKTYWRKLFDARGHAMANGVLAVARAMLSYACDEEEWLTSNPAFALKLTTVPPRVSVWSPAEVETAVNMSDAMGLHELGDAIVIALHTGQRQGDVLALEEPRIDGGRARFRQGKTGAQVAVPFTDQLEARLEMIRQRRRSLTGVIKLQLARRVIMADDGEEYTAYRLRKQFATMRNLVAKSNPDTLSGFKDKTFADLRDTAITRLALAECTVAEIRAITGHSIETVHSVLKHYLALDDRMASSAIQKLQAWMAAEGVAI